jgi:hypothetical protein
MRAGLLTHSGGRRIYWSDARTSRTNIQLPPNATPSSRIRKHIDWIAADRNRGSSGSWTRCFLRAVGRDERQLVNGPSEFGCHFSCSVGYEADSGDGRGNLPRSIGRPECQRCRLLITHAGAGRRPTWRIGQRRTLHPASITDIDCFFISRHFDPVGLYKAAQNIWLQRLPDEESSAIDRSTATVMVEPRRTGLAARPRVSIRVGVQYGCP